MARLLCDFCLPPRPELVIENVRVFVCLCGKRTITKVQKHKSTSAVDVADEVVVVLVASV